VWGACLALLQNHQSQPLRDGLQKEAHLASLETVQAPVSEHPPVVCHLLFLQRTAGVPANPRKCPCFQRFGEPAGQALFVHDSEEVVPAFDGVECEGDIQQGAAVQAGKLLRTHLLLHGQPNQVLAF